MRSGLMAAAYRVGHAIQAGLSAPLAIMNRGELAALYCFVFLFMAGPWLGHLEGRRRARSQPEDDPNEPHPALATRTQYMPRDASKGPAPSSVPSLEQAALQTSAAGSFLQCKAKNGRRAHPIVARLRGLAATVAFLGCAQPSPLSYSIFDSPTLDCETIPRNIWVPEIAVADRRFIDNLAIPDQDLPLAAELDIATVRRSFARHLRETGCFYEVSTRPSGHLPEEWVVQLSIRTYEHYWKGRPLAVPIAVVTLAQSLLFMDSHIAQWQMTVEIAISGSMGQSLASANGSRAGSQTFNLSRDQIPTGTPTLTALLDETLERVVESVRQVTGFGVSRPNQSPGP